MEEAHNQDMSFDDLVRAIAPSLRLDLRPWCEAK
jgi:hypothetical protein